MTVDRNDGYAKVINALTGAIVAFRATPDTVVLYDKCSEALTHVIRDLPERTGTGQTPDDDHRTPLLPWMPRLDLVGSPDEGGSWMILVDHVDIGTRYQNHEQASIAYFAVDAAINRIRQYSRSAAESFYRENAG